MTTTTLFCEHTAAIKDTFELKMTSRLVEDGFDKRVELHFTVKKLDGRWMPGGFGEAVEMEFVKPFTRAYGRNIHVLY